MVDEEDTVKKKKKGKTENSILFICTNEEKPYILEEK